MLKSEMVNNDSRSGEGGVWGGGFLPALFKYITYLVPTYTVLIYSSTHLSSLLLSLYLLGAY